MKQTQTWRWVPAALLLALGGTVGRAQNVAIQSFDAQGRLTFLADGSATNYCIEWAASPSGPWTNTWTHLLDMPVPVSGVVTCSVPMFYRVAATAHPYLVVDISGGPSAPNYPVLYLSDVPPGGWTDEHKTTKLVMRRIPATAGYTMGSPSGELGRQSNETQHQVTLTQDFYIGVFEVTQKQWERVMGSAPSSFAGDKLPVEMVSYYNIRENPNNNSRISPNWPQSAQVHADSFMGKLRARTGIAGFDLPTESQWEYACRAKTTRAYDDQTKNGGGGSDCLTIGSGSDGNLEPLAWYYANSSSGPWEVGIKQANAWGLYDMHGNVWEWCLDWYGTYLGTVTDPKGTSSGSSRVYRGGSWLHYAYACRSAFRGNGTPDYCNSRIGFRACYVPSGQP